MKVIPFTSFPEMWAMEITRNKIQGICLGKKSILRVLSFQQEILLFENFQTNWNNKVELNIHCQKKLLKTAVLVHYFLHLKMLQNISLLHIAHRHLRQRLANSFDLHIFYYINFISINSAFFGYEHEWNVQKPYCVLHPQTSKSHDLTPPNDSGRISTFTIKCQILDVSLSQSLSLT